MARSKQNKSKAKAGDGKHRAETKEERRIRLEKLEESRQQCLKLIPYGAGLLFLLMLMFAMYVRSVPPKTPTLTPEMLEKLQKQMPPMGGGGLDEPGFMKVNTEGVKKPEEKEPAAEEASAEEETATGAPAPPVEETIEL